MVSSGPHSAQPPYPGPAHVPTAPLRVAILDDVITSGESALIACEAAESYKAEVVRVLSAVDRNQGATQVFQQRGYTYTTLYNISELLEPAK